MARPNLLEGIRARAIAFKGAPEDIDAVVALVGNARLVLIGEASHGTHEFYRIRAEITKRLITQMGFRAIAVEGQYPRSRKHQRDQRGDEDEIEFVPVTLPWCHGPVEKEAARQMDGPDRDEHVDGQDRGGDERERAADQQQPANEFDGANEDGEGIGGREAELREERRRTGQAASAPQSKEFLRAVRDKYRPEREPDHDGANLRHEAVLCHSFARDLQYPRDFVNRSVLRSWCWVRRSGAGFGVPVAGDPVRVHGRVRRSRKPEP